MLKELFTALTGISEEDIDSQESQDTWESRRYADEHDLDDDDSDDETGDEPENVKPWLGWFGL